MKRIIYSLTLFAAFSLLTSCATIIGGSRYAATVAVPDHPSSKISYKERYLGNGTATFKVKRREANAFSVTVKEEGCDEQTFDFTQRSYRGWALVGKIVGWTGLIYNIPVPWGLVIDSTTGALWKPNINEPGVSKIDYRHYYYALEYNGCKRKDEISKK